MALCCCRFIGSLCSCHDEAEAGLQTTEWESVPKTEGRLASVSIGSWLDNN